MGSHPSFTIAEPARMMPTLAEKLIMPQVNQTAEPSNIMGDKSPKSNQKKSSQKQSKISSDQQKKQAVVAAKSAAAKKR